MEELVSQFAVAWHDEDDKGLRPDDGYVTGNRRKAGLHRVLDILERNYIIIRREKDVTYHEEN
jgi:hypothetical protein